MHIQPVQMYIYNPAKRYTYNPAKRYIYSKKNNVRLMHRWCWMENINEKMWWHEWMNDGWGDTTRVINGLNDNKKRNRLAVVIKELVEIHERWLIGWWKSLEWVSDFQISGLLSRLINPKIKDYILAEWSTVEINEWMNEWMNKIWEL